MIRRREALVLGIGNLLWADEGFGVRAAEALHAAYAFPEEVTLADGGTQGLYLFDLVASSRRVLVFDAIDFGLPPGTLRLLRDAAVPAWGAVKVSPHQTGLHDILALAMLRGESPERVTLIGVQPEDIADFGGGLRDAVRARLTEAVSLGADELAAWGLPGRPRSAGEIAEPLNARALAVETYEQERPSVDEACRIGDPRVLANSRR